MKRYKGLIKETWWLWLIFLSVGVIGGYFLPAALVTLPMTFFSFLYFGFMRYDADGNPREMD